MQYPKIPSPQGTEFSWSERMIHISLRFFPKGPVDKSASCGSGDDLVLNRQQAINLTHDGPG